jgi:hypothetical protein
MRRNTRAIDELAIAGDSGDSADWYLTVRCASSECGRLIAFQKALYRGDQPNLRIAIHGEPTVHCPHCRKLMRINIEQIERRRVIVVQ